uniref:F-box domain-containing protein n=1 Tax=viral metagenome TaxID=1070528 RepID=A0A6C0C9Q0_9ZZZZ
MEIIPSDVILKISEHLTDYEKLCIAMTSKLMDNFKYKMTYVKKIHIQRIKNKSYFDNFENIEISDPVTKCPKYVKNIYFEARTMDFSSHVKVINSCKITHLSLNDHFNRQIEYTIPSSVTHLQFGKRYNKLLSKCIPQSVTHLTFGDDFNQSILNEIPSSVTHLTFGHSFNQSINDAIPSSVTHLTLGWRFDLSINDAIPPLVTHLTLMGHFNQSIENCIPSSIKYIKFGILFNQSINDIPESVEEIVLSRYYRREINDTLISKTKRYTV